MIQEANDILDSGLTRQQTEIALKKARMAYDISNKKNRPAGKNYYACLIYKLEHELGMHTKTLREVKMLALEYYRKNPELFKQEDEEVLKIMIERDYTCDKPITAAQDDNTNFVDYAETKLGFKIKYPSDWKVNGSDILNQY